MVRNMGRDVVKYGHWDAYLAAHKALNKESVRVGLPAYRLYGSEWGTLNEVFSEAEFESSDDILARFKVAIKDADYAASLKVLLEHVVDGMSHTYVLSEENLD